MKCGGEGTSWSERLEEGEGYGLTGHVACVARHQAALERVDGGDGGKLLHCRLQDTVFVPLLSVELDQGFVRGGWETGAEEEARFGDVPGETCT